MKLFQKSLERQKRLGKRLNETAVTEVLIVEDDLVTVRLHKYVVEKYFGTEVKTFLNGEQVYNYLETAGNTDKKILMLLDINMPEMNGWELLKKVENKPYASQLTVAIVSSSPTRQDLCKAEELDLVKAYFQKPLKVENLKEFFD